MQLLTIRQGRLLVEDAGGQLLAWVDTWEDFVALATVYPNMGASSTVDFPEEYTADPDIIALCRRIRE